MSQLTSSIRKVIGKGQTTGGRGRTWMYVGEKNQKQTYIQNEKTIESLKQAFPEFITAKHEHSNTQFFVFFIYNSKNEYLGSCKIDRWDNIDEERFIVVDYTTMTKQQILLSIKEYSN